MLSLINRLFLTPKIRRSISTIVSAVMVNFLLLGNANAHMITAQNGTLNVLDDGIFMIVSLPVSAFSGVDENEDGNVSLTEFSNNRVAISKKLRKNLSLSDENATYPIKGMLLSPVISHHATDDSINQVVVMGKFMMNDDPATNNESEVTFQLNIFGEQDIEKILKITLTRQRDQLKKVFSLTPKYHRVVIL